MKRFAPLAGIALMSAMFASPAAMAEDIDIQGKATIIQTITLTSPQALDFASITVPGGSSDAIVLSMAVDGSVDAGSTGAVLSGTPEYGSFNLVSSGAVQISTPASVELKDTKDDAKKMSLTNFRFFSDEAGNEEFTGKSFTPGGIGKDVRVTADLNMTKDQAGGTYQGNIKITVDAG